MKSKLFISNSTLKLIAIITMTIDHLGFMFQEFYPGNSTLMAVADVFRIIGRIAFPLFCYLAVEGALHTRNVAKYILRMGIILAAILITQIVMDFGFNQRFYQGNIFIDLILGILIVILLEQKKSNWLKLLLIPIFAYGILAFICYGFEFKNGGMIWAFPYFLRPQYDVMGLIYCFGFYLAKKIITPAIFKERGLDVSLYEKTDYFKWTANAFVALLLAVITIGQYMFATIGAFKPYIYFDANCQVWACLAALLIIFYSAEKGYSKKWFQYACYLYYPLHLVILYSVFYLATHV